MGNLREGGTLSQRIYLWNGDDSFPPASEQNKSFLPFECMSPFLSLKLKHPQWITTRSCQETGEGCSGGKEVRRRRNCWEKVWGKWSKEQRQSHFAFDVGLEQKSHYFWSTRFKREGIIYRDGQLWPVTTFEVAPWFIFLNFGIFYSFFNKPPKHTHTYTHTQKHV